MDDQSGREIAKAMKAILEMQKDCIKLFRDIDKELSDYRSYYTNVVTLNLGSTINRPAYLAEGLIRLYVRGKTENEVLGVNICFHDDQLRVLEEPIFVVALTRYLSTEVDPKEYLLKGWDPWSAFLVWSPGNPFGESFKIESPVKRSNIASMSVVARPLYEITSLERAMALIDLVGRPAL